MQIKSHRNILFATAIAVCLLATAFNLPLSLAAANQDPNADFDWTPTGDILTGQTVNFQDQSTDPDGTIIAWEWDFDDGTYSIVKNPSHVYTDDGTYDVNLRVIDNNGSSDAITQQVTIDNRPPVADAGPNQQVNTSVVSFTGQASSDPDGTIAIYQWNFGDNETGTGKNVDHDYDEDGQYTVTLNVTDDDGATDGDTTKVTVDTHPPITTATLNGTEGAHGWFISNVTVTLEADDDIMGVDATYYAIDDGNWTDYTDAFVIDDSGEHMVYYYSDDEAGNKENISSVNVDIDISAPTVTITTPSEGRIHFFGRDLLPSIRDKTIILGRITVEVDVSDEQAGINKVRFLVDDEVQRTKFTTPYTWTWGFAFGRHTLGVNAVDNAGYETMKELDVTIFSILPAQNSQVQVDIASFSSA